MTPAQRPPDEPDTRTRYDKIYYTSIVTLSADHKERKHFLFFREEKEPTGWYRYEQPHYDWYITTAIEKLNKLPVEEQEAVDRQFVFGLRYAIRQRYQRGGSAVGDLPTCHNTRRAVDKWIQKTLDQYEDKID